MTRRTKATLTWGLAPYVCAMAAVTAWESAAVHHFDPHFLSNWLLHLFLIVVGALIALPGVALQWRLPDRHALLAIPLGFFFAVACVAVLAGACALAFHSVGSYIGMFLFVVFFCPPAALGGMISGFIRARDRTRASAAVAGSI